MSVRVEHGDCLDVMATLAAEGVTVDAIVTDPPYGLKFMGKAWDHGVPGVPFWLAAKALLKPGGHLIAFGGTRTYHRLACAIEDAGFEIRDQLQWLFGSGFPKSHDVSKAIDKAAGAEREVVGSKLGRPGYSMSQCDDPGGVAMSGNVDQSLRNPDQECSITAPSTDAAKQWDGWGTALKPACEPIVLARKPLSDGTVAANVLRHGTGAVSVDGCRVASGDENPSIARRKGAINHLSKRPDRETEAEGKMASRQSPDTFRAIRPGEQIGRWPANVVHDGSDEVLAAFAAYGDGKGAAAPVTGDEPSMAVKTDGNIYNSRMRIPSAFHGDTGTAARFFYSAKADTTDRAPHCAACGWGSIGSTLKTCPACGEKLTGHPTVKPVDLMRWLVRLVTPKKGTVLDPFAGTGTTGMACLAEGFDAILIEREAEYVADIERRIAHVSGGDTPLFAPVAEGAP